MNNNLIKEIKYRSFFIFLNWFILTNIFYLYKEILLFNIFKKLNYFNTLEFYLVYTNITELFTIYIKLINFFTLQIIFIFILYHIIIFCIPTFYKKEFKLIISFFYFIFILNNIYLILFLKLCNLLIEFLKNFQEPYMYFEIKINEILEFLLQTFLHFQFIFIILTLLIVINIYKNIILLRKLNYFLLILLSIYFYLINKITKLLILWFLFIIFELFLFLIILKTKT